ncbi:MAG: hypothetical protein JWN44_5009 [Myxococcales bacterium]|nr:hypothetical protein [Myxococcales bacterium]
MGAWVRFVGVMAIGATVGGCGGTDSTTLDKWVGSVRHLRVTGFMMGEKLDINLATPDANDMTKLWCEREYQVPNDANSMPNYAGGHNSEIRIKGQVVVNGQARLLDFGLKRHNWQAQTAGTAVPVIPRDDANSPCGLAGCTNDSMWLSWTWRNPADNSVTYKSAAQSGSVTLGEYVGTPDTTGLLIPAGTGNVGGFAKGQWSATDSISASFDANCLKNVIDNSY